jgi:ubiquinone/menaquinone biosynthesis C-methylase UbiE
MLKNARNWVGLWQMMLMSEGRYEAFNKKYWETHVNNFVLNTTQMADLTKKQLDRLQISPDSSVLEVGSGTGRITIPIAKRTKRVTAVEPTQGMLRLLKENAQRENITNIDFIDKSWEEVVVGKDVPIHDIAFASFSLFMKDIEMGLRNLNAVAKKRVYIFTLASKWVEDDIQKLVYGDVTPLEVPDYLYLYHILHDLGILANIDICEYDYDRCFASPEACLIWFLDNYNVPAKKVDAAKEYLRGVIIEKDEKFWFKRNQKMAMIWWDKAPPIVSSKKNNKKEEESCKTKKLL